MKFSLESITDKNYIASYGDDHIDVKNDMQPDSIRLSSAVILSPTQIIDDWQFPETKQFTDADIALLKQLEPELLVLVTNTTVSAYMSEIVAQMSSLAIGVECMQLGAACRTFNLLVAEGRNVVMVVKFD
jgi:uncharacterized protein